MENLNVLENNVFNINDFIECKINLIINKHLSDYDMKTRKKYESGLIELFNKYIN